MPCSAEIAQAIVDLINDDRGVVGLAFNDRSLGGKRLVPLEEARLCRLCSGQIETRNFMSQYCSRACYNTDRAKGKTDE